MSGVRTHDVGAAAGCSLRVHALLLLWLPARTACIDENGMLIPRIPQIATAVSAHTALFFFALP